MSNAIVGFLSMLASVIGSPSPDVTEAAPMPEIAGSVEATPKQEIARPPENAPSEAQPEAKTAGGPVNPVKCQIQVEGGSSQRNIVALATAVQAPQSGTFTLEIEKKGPNTARSRQHGDFVLATGETKRLAKVRMSVGANETVAGHLLLNGKGGETVCEIK